MLFSSQKALAITTTINNSSTYASTASLAKNHLIQTSDGTLHSFIQIGTQTATCGGSSKSGLLWFYSTDTGATWTCGGQLSSDTTNYMYADAKIDSSDNIHVEYSKNTAGAVATNDVFYQKLTKGVGATWIVETAQTVLDGTASATSCTSGLNTGSYTWGAIEVEGTTRLWLAARCFDGTYYQHAVYYSDGFGSGTGGSYVAPTWTLSNGALDTTTTGTDSVKGGITLVRFGTNKIGVIYQWQGSSYPYKWRFRQDSDPLTSWSGEASTSFNSASAESFRAIGTTDGRIFAASTTLFGYYNGQTWSSSITVGANSTWTGGASIATDGTNAWIFYADTTGLSANLPEWTQGGRKLVYIKCSPPFASTADCDASATPVVSYHGTFDKAWSFVASSYTDITTAAGNSTTADTQLVTSSGDIAYFGKSTTFDAISWDLSTLGNSGGAITWEYCSHVDVNTACDVWSGLTQTSRTSAAADDFEADGYRAFTVPGDWAVAKVNSEATAYYYIRARATASYTTSPVGVQIVAIPPIGYMTGTPAIVSGNIHLIWTENTASPIFVRYTSISVTASTAPASTASISPTIAGYSSTTAATHPSTMRHIVRTSDGTLHAFIQGGTQLTCGGATGSNNVGLNWLYSTDSGSTWTCGGQLNSNSSSNLMYADTRVDSSDNIYVVYSVATTGRNDAYDVFYRKLTKGSGQSWTVESAQTVLDGSGSGTAYHYATVELEGTTRLWLATRYFDGTNYGITVYYSDGLGAVPTWIQSVTTLNSEENPTQSGQYYPAMVRFGSNIGVLYDCSGSSPVNCGNYNARWRYRADSTTDLTSWVAQTSLGGAVFCASWGNALFSAVGTASGNIYTTWNCGSTTTFSYYNYSTSTWSTSLTVGTSLQSTYSSVTTDGTNVWVFYGQTTDLSSGLSGSRTLVYKKGVSPFAAANFDTNSTAIVSQHGIFDKVWTYISSSYINDTTDAGNTTSADVAMPSASGDIIYFGKTAKYDAISWDLSTFGVGGLVAWEYYNGSTWMPLTTYFAVSNNVFITGDGYITFNPHSDWATTAINGEGTSYYYVRARVTTAYSIAPVGVQMAAIPQINWANVAASTTGVYAIWTENAASPTRIRYSTVLTHDQTAPSISLTALSTDPTSDTTPTLTGTATDATGTVSNVQYQMDGTGGSWSSCSADDGSFDETSDAFSCTPSALSDGSHTMYVRATDSVSNTTSSGSESSDSFTVDTTGPAAPTGLASSDHSTSTWSTDNTVTVTWTASSDSGSGLSGYSYTFDTTSDTTPDTTSDIGAVTTVTSSALSDGSAHYFHIRAVDGLSNWGSATHLGPFYIDTTSPVSFDLDSPGHESYSTNQRPTFKWKATTDATSGLSSYTLEVDNGSSGDFSITGIPTSRTTDYETSKYLVHYEGGYISIYTKSSSSWGSSENDGKLKEGSVGWKIKAVDSAGNERSEGRTVIVDLTGPTLSSVSVSDSLGSKDSYEILTDTTPAITGTVADSYPSKVEASVYKESYFLGILTDITLLSTYSQTFTTNSASQSFSISSSVLDLGSYQATVKGTDKAGNSTSQTIYFKVMTGEEAQKILKGKLSEEDKKTIQENAQVSLPALEKKAKLRREKEAGELNKFLTDLKSMGNGLNLGVEGIAEQFKVAVQNLGNVILEGAIATDRILRDTIASGSSMTGEGIKIATGYALAMTNSVLVKPFQNLSEALDNSADNVQQEIARAYKSMPPMVSMNQILRPAADLGLLVREATYQKLSDGSKVITQIAVGTVKVNQEINLALENSVGSANKRIAEAGRQTSNLALETLKAPAAAISTTNQILAGVGQGTVEKVKDTVKAVQLASRSFAKPIQGSTDFLERVKVGALTFESIVFDPNPTAITNVAIEEVGTDYAVVSWETNHYAWGKVNYGEDLKYGEEVILRKREKYHQARLTGLEPGQKYFFEVMSQNKNYVYDAYYSFETNK